MGRKLGGDRARYAVYVGGLFLASGTAEQCAQQLGISPKTVRWYASPAASRRNNGNGRTAIRIDGRFEQ